MQKSNKVELPQISLPKGGGAVKGIGETFQPNPFTGTGNLSIPVYTTQCRGFEPKLTLNYNSGSGSSIFGLGFSLSIPNISRKTEKGLPKYDNTDTFLISNAEDLVPQFNIQGNEDEKKIAVNGINYNVKQYRPRIEGLYAKIELWENRETKNLHWEVTTKENVKNIYGKKNNSKIFKELDSNNLPVNIFKWLLEETIDAKGNRIIYEYKQEDTTNVPAEIFEENRNHFSNKYIKRIKYGNYFDNNNEEWAFEIVFDYGEHTDNDNPYLENQSGWLKRPDSFSIFKPGFEIRTHRLCKRIMMFHHFKNESCGDECLVRSTDFKYDKNEIMTFLTVVTQKGFRKDKNGKYFSEIFPPLEFKYSSFDIKKHSFKILTIDDDYEIPGQIDEAGYNIIDLFGEGLPGILYSDNKTLKYWQNEGGGKFYSSKSFNFPIHKNIQDSSISLEDLGGDGRLDLVINDGFTRGYYQSMHEGNWENFKTFESYPSIDLNNPYIERADLDGDGHTDIMVIDNIKKTIYKSLGKKGFTFDSEKLNKNNMPVINSAGASEIIRYASMFGDGLQHRIRIRDGVVECWPNLGHGRFGDKIRFKNSPKFQGKFDPSRLFIADVDGSGTADIIYLNHNNAEIYLNKSGNSFSDPVIIDLPGNYDNFDKIQVADVTGSGASCLVISRNETGKNKHQYYDFTGGIKPHLITEINNNMGAVTRIKYSPSTKYYIEDKKNNKPWISRLSFPVHVIEKTETIDLISKTKLVTRYKYHHGYYDGEEREFRGFGCVEQWDTESFELFNEADLFDGELFDLTEDKLHVPPVYTKTWFHTGAYIEEDIFSKQFESEYYKKDSDALLLDDTVLDFSLIDKDSKTIMQAHRALKGQVLRREIYSVDGKDGYQEHPYTVTESNFKVRLLQKSLSENHPVFFVHPNETVKYYYERMPHDPRIEHDFTLEIDNYGNVKKSVKIYYPRRSENSGAVYEEQKDLKVLCTLNNYINEINNFYLLGVLNESKNFEIGGFDLAEKKYFKFNDVELQVNEALNEVIRFDQKLNGNKLQARLLSWERIFFWNKNQTDKLVLGNITERALSHHSEKAVFSFEQIYDIFENNLNDNILIKEGGYEKHDGYWWNPGLKNIFYKENDKKFFLIHKTEDSFRNVTEVNYDNYSIAPVKIIDPLMNEINSENDYYTIQPLKLTDINKNTSEVLFDPMGLVVAVTVHGTEGNKNTGDSALDNFEYLKPVEIRDIIDNPHDYIQKASSYFYYDLFAFKQNSVPVYSINILKEKYESDLDPGEKSRLQFHILYSDGLGRDLQKKVLVEKGRAFIRDENNELVKDDAGEFVEDEVEKRWLVSGRTVYNNKSKPVKQYEPFYSSTYFYEKEIELTEYGVTPVIHYDPLLRVIRTDTPKGFYLKTGFTPWMEQVFDENDTVTDSDYHAKYDELSPEEQTALDKTIPHDNTPVESMLNNLGQKFLMIETNLLNKKLYTHKEIDILGNELSLTDPRQFILNQGRSDNEKIKNFEYHVDMTGFKLLTKSTDAGTVKVLNNIFEKQLHSWDGKGYHIKFEYDKLMRPFNIHVSGSCLDQTVEKMIYGDASADDVKNNLNGKLKEHFDQAGKEIFKLYDIQGNVRIAERQLRKKYKEEVNWDNNEELLNKTYTVENKYDALKRIIHVKNPDESYYYPEFHQSGWLNKVSVKLKDENDEQVFVKSIDYNPRGQRLLIKYGNDTATEYTYEKETFRLTNLKTYSVIDNKEFQNILYTYDPVGNIVRIYDHSHKRVFTNQQEVEPLCEYKYDALYRLTEASGREHPALAGVEYKGGELKQTLFKYLNNTGDINDDKKLQHFTRRYTYDDAGSLTKINHLASQTARSWTRDMKISNISNRAIIKKESTDENPEDFFDENGNLLELDHLRNINWNYRNNISSCTLIERDAVSDGEYYVYDSRGERVRKISECLINGNDIKIEEKIYIGSCEIKSIRIKKAANETEILHRKSLHIMDDKKRISLVHLWKKDRDKTETEDLDVYKLHYQYSNHLGSSSLELTDKRDIISYEEYFPYGGTSFAAGNKKLNISPKEYRYSGKERDDVTGLYYYGARYYAPWIFRWINPDPAGTVDGPNLYVFVMGNPVRLYDEKGEQAVEDKSKEFTDSRTIRLKLDDQQNSQFDKSSKQPDIRIEELVEGDARLRVMLNLTEKKMRIDYLPPKKEMKKNRSGFKEIDEAVKAAYQEIWELSQLEGYEYGGVIYQIGKGENATFGYSKARTDKSAGHVKVDPKKIRLPKGAKVVGAYHTHVGSDDEFWNAINFFQHLYHSEADKEYAGYYGFEVFLANYRGEIKGFKKEKEREVGTVDHEDLQYLLLRDIFEKDTPPEKSLDDFRVKSRPYIQEARKKMLQDIFRKSK